ncbi:Flp family type IVb pilin [Zophobihabitans entericus]|uniref:Flp family type IVb pilin n=2 Tax=Zophobihabitans entericus TaxID=1635327 RepID=A0A6G9IDV3_9GAMM|nr:Flp family type IVb pilin [Zophobihabitans entericus]
MLKLGSFFKREEGVTAIEYAIVVAGVAAVVLIVFASDGPVATALTEVFETLGTTLKGMVSSS